MTPRSTLRLAPKFTLPLDVVTEATGIVATRGAGKSSASAVVVEEGFAADVQSVVFDRTGVYWGLRSNAAGDGPGLPIYVLGGPHGDVPLEQNAGAMIADLVVDSGHSFVLDFSDFSKSATIRFAADFLERIYDRKARSRTTTLLVIDEAHFYAPQTPRGGFKGDAARLMGAMEDVVGLGRSRGLGVVLTTQRTQALNKAVLDLVETLLVMRMLSPRARDAVRAWIMEKHEDDEQGVIGTLDSLPTGTAWIWSPLRGILEQVALRRIQTFDSYETPKPGQRRREPTKRRQLDLDALGEQIRATAEKAKANDPAELRKRIRDLERRLAEQRAPAPAETVTVEVPVIADEDLGFLRSIVNVALPKWLEIGEAQASGLRDAVAPLAAALDKISGASAPLTAGGDAARARRNPPAAPLVSRERRGRLTVEDRVQRDGSVERTAFEELGKGERAVLGVLAEYPEGRTMNELAFLAGYSAKASTIGVILSTLRKLGYVHPGNQPVRPTADGLAAVGGPIARPTGDALLEQWLRHPRMGEGERRVLLTLLDLYPDETSNDQLAELTGYSPTASTLGVIISKLRKLGLVEKGRRRLTDEFVDAIREQAAA